jgi:glutathione synthase/RimK-type ligase-like ATP-grasp enzyme
LREALGQAEAAVWSDRDVDWPRFAGVVIRSCWDYHLRVEEFLSWIDGLERRGIPVVNSPSLIRWNVDKRYLEELSNKGIRIPDTLWLGCGEQVDLEFVCRQRGWKSAVVKPLVSASAYRTERRDRGDVLGPMMIQEYVEEIETQGEWSLMYFSGEFSHAVRKRARAGEFRVQSEFGGTAELDSAPADVRTAAEAALAATPSLPVYARVDLVQQSSIVALMELELIEPELFLKQSARASRRLAGAIVRSFASV